jgi:hypothetical protein
LEIGELRRGVTAVFLLFARACREPRANVARLHDSAVTRPDH